MKLIVKPLAVALSAVAFSFAAISLPAQAMSLAKAESVILHWVKKDAKKVEKHSKGVAEAGKKGSDALAAYCRNNTGECIGIAIELAALAL